MGRRFNPISQAGFGLLEAIVALALLAGTGVAVLSWFHSSLLQLDRSAEREARARLLANATALLASIDVDSRESGREEFEGAQMQWRVEPVRLVAPADSTNAEVSSGWSVELVRVTAQVQTLHEERPLRVDLEVLRAVARPATSSPRRQP